MLQLTQTQDCFFAAQNRSCSFVPFAWRGAMDQPRNPFRFAQTGTGIETVAAVGACYMNGVGFAPSDVVMIRDALDSVSRLGFCVAAEGRVTPVNLVYGVDVLKPCALRSDLFIACLVCNPSPQDAVGDQTLHWTRWTSTLHRVPSAWGQSAFHLGSKAVVAYSFAGARTEIAGRDFVRGRYYKLVASDLVKGTYEGEAVRLRRDILVPRTLSVCHP